jgi:hypothetical protein
MWNFLKIKGNREIIGWIAGGVAAIAAAGWAVYKDVWSTEGVAKGDCKVEAVASQAGCGDINNFAPININAGSPAPRKP